MSRLLLLFTVIGVFALSGVGWGAVIFNEGFEGYELGSLPNQVDPFTGGVWTGTVATNSVTINYECNALPEAASPAWSRDYGTLTTAAATGGVLTIADGSTSDGIAYGLDVLELDNMAGTTVTFRARCTSWTAGSESAVRGLVIRDGAQETIISVTPSKVKVWNSASTYTVTAEYALDGTAWHTYQVTAQGFAGSTRVMVYVDGSSVPAIAASLNVSTTTQKRIIIGSTSNSVAATWDYDYVRITTGSVFGPGNAGIPQVVADTSTSSAQVATWKTTGAGITQHNCDRMLPLPVTHGNCHIYASIRMDGAANVGTGGNVSYLRMFDALGMEAMRLYIASANDGAGSTGQLKVLRAPGVQQLLVDNPVIGQWYHIRLDLNVDTRTYDAYFRASRFDPWTLVYQGAGSYFIANGLYRAEWTMWDRAVELGPVSVSLDDLRIETGPPAPAITSLTGGVYTTNASPVVTWVGQPSPQSPVTGYRVKICDQDNANDPTPVYDSGLVSGAANEYVVSGPLPANVHLWAFVAEQDEEGLGQWSAAGNGGFYVAPAIKVAPNNAIVNVDDVVVVAAFTDFLYAGPEDRSWGIRIDKSGHGLQVGAKLAIVGTVKTDAAFERYVEASSITAHGSGSIGALDMSNKVLGGSAFQYEPVSGAGQRGIEDGEGLNNIGLLVRSSGRVTAVGDDFFYIDDGTHAHDASVFNGVRVLCGNLSKPDEGDYAVVTGISSISKVSGRLFRGLTPRTQEDIDATQ